MRRGSLPPLIVGVLALGVAFTLSRFGGVHLLPSYLAAWLFCLGVPVGALAILMALEIAGAADAALTDPLRSTVAAMPVLALLAVPILLDPDALYPDATLGAAPLHGATTPFVVRAVVFLLLWTLLSLVFQRRPRRFGGLRRTLAVIGLAVHAIIGTVAANDWRSRLTLGWGRRRSVCC